MPFHKRNYYAFLWHAAFLALTTAFTDINTVLPALVVQAGGSEVLIGLLTAIMVGTPILGQLLFASYLHLKQRKKGFLLLGINLRVFALAAVAFLLTRSTLFSASTLIVLVFLLMFLFASSGTFAAVSYTDILGKSLQVDQRSRFFVNRQVLTSLAILASAPLTRWILKNYPYPANYTGLFAGAAILLLIASIGFWAVREPASEPADQTLGFLEVLRAIPGHLRDNPPLRRYILLINLTGFGLTLMPFYVAYARHHYGLSGEQIGSYLMVQIVGMVVSNLLWARLVKKFGFDGVIRGCIICGALLPVLTLLLGGLPLPVFLIVFFLMGTSLSARKIAFSGKLIEITEDNNRALFQGIVGATSLTTALFPLIAGSLILTLGYTPVFIAVAAIVASAWLTTILKH